MKLPVYLDGQTIRDAENRVVVSAINPCDMAERRQIVEALNATAKAKDEKPKCRYRNEEILKERSVGGHMLLLSRYADTEQDNHEFFGIALDCVIVNSGTLKEMEGKFRQWVKHLRNAEPVDCVMANPHMSTYITPPAAAKIAKEGAE